MTIDNDTTAYEVWEALTDIPVDANDFIECDFLHFEKGDNKFEIWDWIEEKFDISIGNTFF